MNNPRKDDPRIQPEEFVWKSEFDEVDEIEENKKSAKKTALANLKNGTKNEDLVTSRTDGESSKNENDSADGPSSESTQTSYFGMISNSFNSWFRIGFYIEGAELELGNILSVIFESI